MTGEVERVGDRLGSKQRAVLLLLMAEAGEASNVDLQARHKVTLTGEDRRRLNDLKLVASHKPGRAYVHELTDQGWRWCADELSAEAPPRAGSLGAALYGVLGGLRGHLDRAGLALGDVFAPGAGDTIDDDVHTDVSDEVDVEDRIRATYRTLAKGSRDWVGLADLRPLLGDADRAEVDAALLRMHRRPDVHIVPESNRKALTEEDHAAAVRIGGEDKHLLAIEDT